jgi:MFS family permease
MSLVSVVSYFLSGWASDRMSLKYLLITLLASLSIGCLGMLAFETQWSRIIVIICFGVQGGVWGCLSLVTWPRFYGRKHLGAISGLFMSCQVFASAIGPPTFGASEYFTGNYHNVAWAMVVLNMVLLIGSFRARKFYRSGRNIATDS